MHMEILNVILAYVIPFLVVLTVLVFVHETGPLPDRAALRRPGRGLLDRFRARDLRLDRQGGNALEVLRDSPRRLRQDVRRRRRASMPSARAAMELRGREPGVPSQDPRPARLDRGRRASGQLLLRVPRHRRALRLLRRAGRPIIGDPTAIGLVQAGERRRRERRSHGRRPDPRDRRQRDRALRGHRQRCANGAGDSRSRS